MHCAEYVRVKCLCIVPILCHRRFCAKLKLVIKDKNLTHTTKMQKAVLTLFVLSCVLALAYGDLVCGSNYCKQNPCSNKVAASSCRSPSVYRANHAGKCACCPACVTLLSEGAACKVYSKELGETPPSVCKEPLICLTGVCTKIVPRG